MTTVFLYFGKALAMLVLVETTIRLLSRYARPEWRGWLLVAAVTLGGFGLALL